MTRARAFLILGLIVVAIWLLPALHQDEKYHHFADQRTLLGVPNFWNVITNAPFAIVGVIGLIMLTGAASRILFFGFSPPSDPPIIIGLRMMHVSCGTVYR